MSNSYTNVGIKTRRLRFAEFGKLALNSKKKKKSIQRSLGAFLLMSCVF
jgi:hypothetical protein